MKVDPEDVNQATLFLPTPVVVVLENMGPIADAYLETRVEAEPLAAMLKAIERVLPNDQCTEVFAFLRGEVDEQFGEGEGSALVQTIVDQVESQYTLQVILSEAPAGHTTPQPTSDIVDLAEWVAGNPHKTFAYRRALDEHPILARSLVDGAVEDILAIASRARTKIGRKVKTEQAEKVIRMLGNKARAHTGDLAAANQAIWCEALVATLKPLRK